MNSIEFEETIWNTRMREYRFPKVDIIKDGFRPKSGKVGDFCSVEHKGRYHFFYIEHRLTESLAGYYGNVCYIGHASTANFFEWEVHYPEIWVQPGTWEHLHVAAPNIINYQGRFIMAYTGANEYATQNIGLAFSDDLFHWKRWEKNPLSPCKDKSWAFWREDGPTSCRDPHLLIYDSKLWMAYTANTKGGASCIALTSTRDFERWEDHGPILLGPNSGYEPSISGRHPQGQLESSNLINNGKRWFLLVQWIKYNSNVDNWIFESNTINHFDLSIGREFWQGTCTIEVVKEECPFSLLASFSLARTIKFGVVDWSIDKPTARFITTAEELRKWSKE